MTSVSSRRTFVQGLAAGGALTGIGLWPDSGWTLQGAGKPVVLAGTEFDLTIGETPMNFTGRTRTAVTVNGSLPGPILRWRQGTSVKLRVTNALPARSIHGTDTSIHWHGIILPAKMDGVPGISFPGIRRGETFEYRFDVKQAGTYWYHSHSGFQEQVGLYGPLIIDPAGPEPFACDRDYVVMLNDWTDLAPAALFARLKKMAGHDNYYQRTVGDFLRDARRDGLRSTLDERLEWGRMRMTPTDLSDVNAHTYTYLMNGTTSVGNWTARFNRGEKIRLRFINGSAMTYFDVRIPGLKMTVVAADGQQVHPVTIDEFRIAVAETLDVIVEPQGQEAFTIFAQDSARTGYVRGTLATREGLAAPVPPLDARPLITMTDTGMSHDAVDHDVDHKDHAGMEGMQHGSSMQTHPETEHRNPLVDGQTMAPKARLDDPGIGLRNNGRQVLHYSMLRSLFADPDGRDPQRELELHLTGHMEKFSWSFSGVRFSAAEPLRLKHGERLRIVLVNDSMMSHPVHLHGLWSDLEDDRGNFAVRKHTIDMPPGTRRGYRVTADALGNWAYHCHLLYHMEAGMMRDVVVEE